MKYVLDTNIVVRLLDGDERVLGRLETVYPEDVGIPLLVAAELFFGAEKSARRAQNCTVVQKLLDTFSVVPLDLDIMRRYAAVRAAVERRGRPKSDFDLIIACTALQHDAVLVTNDAALKDGSIDALRVDDWLLNTIQSSDP